MQANFIVRDNLGFDDMKSRDPTKMTGTVFILRQKFFR